jgi:glycosyltransferase involved in cell wall biosynthesis
VTFVSLLRLAPGLRIVTMATEHATPGDASRQLPGALGEPERPASGRTARRALMVLYFFPPLGGVSMARNVRHAQYLPRYGWTPVVLTPRSGGFELKDPEALGLLAPDLDIIRTRSWEAGHVRPAAIAAREVIRRILPRQRREGATSSSQPGDQGSDAPRLSRLERLRHLLFFPDDQVGWTPFALRAALRSGRHMPFDAVFSTSSPVTSHLVAGLYARLTGTPWIAEFRDPWVGNALAAPLPWLHRRLQTKLERWIVRSANGVVCVTPSLTRLYQRRYPGAAVVTVTNGYDRSERPEPAAATAGTPDRPFRIVYTGTLYRESELSIFLEGVDRLVRRRPDLAASLEIVFIGEATGPCRAVVESFIGEGHLDGVVRLAGFVPRRVAMEAVTRADAALVLLGGGPGMGLFVGGKLYDYLGQDQQILAMVPPGDARDVLEGLSWGVVADPDPADVERAVERLLTLPAPDRPADPEGRYDRAVLAGRLAEVLTEASAADRPHRAGS